MQHEYSRIVKHLIAQGVYFAGGLKPNEISEIEQIYDIRFPLPLLSFYSSYLPISHGFYNWRDLSQQNIRNIKNMLEWPVNCILFDIENNAFWYDGWGTKPNKINDAKQICIEEMKKVPQLIPVYSHRFMPYIEGMDNLPVYSVYQTDIIYYGTDLISYLENEFGIREHADLDIGIVPDIPFWKDIIE